MLSIFSSRSLFIPLSNNQSSSGHFLNHLHNLIYHLPFNYLLNLYLTHPNTIHDASSHPRHINHHPLPPRPHHRPRHRHLPPNPRRRPRHESRLRRTSFQQSKFQRLRPHRTTLPNRLLAKRFLPHRMRRQSLQRPPIRRQRQQRPAIHARASRPHQSRHPSQTHRDV